MDVDDATLPLFYLINKPHSFPPSLSTPDNKQDMVVFFIITMFLLPVVTCAGVVSSTSGNETDHLALLAIKSAIKDPLGALASWNHSLHHCYWEGITRRH